MENILLDVKNLDVVFDTEEGRVNAVSDVSFHVNKGETIGIVGESGCGKSVTALAIMRLVTGKINRGEIFFEGNSLLKLSEEEMEKVRGRDISMIFQEPMTSLNPVYTVGYQIAEAYSVHSGVSMNDSLNRAREMLTEVGVPDAKKRVNNYPHQMSGGMRQRVMIGMALSCNPKLLIADEPTTALDVTIQAQILELMKELQKKHGMSMIVITHNMGVVAEMAERVIVMYCGQIVEQARIVDLFKQPMHPYSEGLFSSIPRMDKSKDPLYIIKGSVPNPLNLPNGCYFHPRCPYVFDKCKQEMPPVLSVDDRLVRCWRYLRY